MGKYLLAFLSVFVLGCENTSAKRESNESAQAPLRRQNDQAHLRASKVSEVVENGKAETQTARPSGKEQPRKSGVSGPGNKDQPLPQERISYWIDRLKDRGTLAEEILIASGRSSVPMLVEALRIRKSYSRVVFVLGEIGPEAKAAVPSLISLLETRDPRYLLDDRYTCAAEALGKIGDARAVPALWGLIWARFSSEPLKSEGSKAAAEALEKLDPRTKQVKALIGALRHKDVVIREKAVRKLVDLDEVSIPALSAAVRDAHVSCKIVCAHALGQIGLKTLKVVPVLAAAANDDHLMVRRYAFEALVRIDPGESAKFVSQRFEERISGDVRFLERQRELEELKSAELITDTEFKEKVIAARLYGLPRMLRCVCLAGKCYHPSYCDRIRIRATVELLRVRPLAVSDSIISEVIKSLHNAIVSADDDLRDKVILVLGKIGRRASESVPILNKLLSVAKVDDDKELFRLITECINRISGSR